MKQYSLNQAWEFQKLPKGNIECPCAPDAVGTIIDLPHTWYDDEAESAYRGLTLYHKQLEILPEWQKKKLFLDIPGADNHALIFLNDRFVIEHKGGYSAFRVEVPDELCRQDTLDIKIYLSNAVCEDISPLAGDFTIFGGLYRGVNLLVAESTHFDVCYYGTDGILVNASVDGIGNGILQIEPHTVGAEDAIIRYTLFAADNTKVLEQTAAPNKSIVLTVEHPSLWDGKVSPYLYRLEAELCCGTTIFDTVSKTIGFRSIRLDAEKGFFLNGTSMRIHGVAKHQDFAFCFNAVGTAEVERDFELIQEIGANAIRLSHYQHPQAAYDRCDQDGYIVWAEIPMLKMTRNPELIENAKQQLKELVLQNIHHPSICFWGIQNEIGMFRDSPDMYDNLAQMAELVREIDPERFVTAANLYTVKMKSGLSRGTDMIGYNIYFGWYYGQMQDYDAFLDRYHIANPTMPFGISEYGVDANPFLHAEVPTVQDYSEEYQALFHETVYPIFESKSYLWGSFVWNMFDFSSAMRKEGGMKNQNGKGLVTMDRKIRKDAFYYYKAKWSKEPFVHLCSKRFEKRTEREISIKTYTNQPQVTLLLNGQEIQTLPNNGNGTVCFKNVLLLDGKNDILVLAGNQKDTAAFWKQKTEEMAYRLPGSNSGKAVKNWFLAADSLVKEGYYSLENTANDLLRNPDTCAVLQKELPELYCLMTEKDIIPLGLSLKSILSRNKVDGEILQNLNAQLNQIEESE